MDVSNISSAAKAIRSTQVELSKLLEEAKRSTSSKRTVCRNSNNKKKRNGLTSDFDHEKKESDTSFLSNGSLENESGSGNIGVRANEDYIQLESEHAFLEKRYHRDFSRLEKELIATKETVSRLSRENQELRTGKRDLHIQVDRMSQHFEQKQQECAEMEMQTERLRKLLTANMDETEKIKAKANEAQDFLRRLSLNQSSTEFLYNSEPPNDFHYSPPRLLSEKNIELQRAQLKLKKSDAEIKDLQTKLENVIKQNVEVKNAQKSRVRQTKNEASAQHLRLLGAMRRIQYLIEEKEKAVEELKKRDGYVSKLENKVLKLNDELAEKMRIIQRLKAQRKALDDAPNNFKQVNASTIMKPKELLTGVRSPPASPVQGVQWTSVYSQNTLATPPSDLKQKIESSLPKECLYAKPVDSKWLEWEHTHSRLENNTKGQGDQDPKSPSLSFISQTSRCSTLSSDILLDEDMQAKSHLTDENEDSEWLAKIGAIDKKVTYG